MDRTTNIKKILHLIKLILFFCLVCLKELQALLDLSNISGSA